VEPHPRVPRSRSIHIHALAAVCCINPLVSLRFGIHYGKFRPCCSPYLKSCANLSARASPVKHSICSFQAFLLVLEPTQLRIYNLNQLRNPPLCVVLFPSNPVSGTTQIILVLSLKLCTFTLKFWCRQAACYCMSYFPGATAVDRLI
jgi:hypothetical protein